MMLESLTWGRRRVAGWPSRQSLHWRPVGGKPAHNSNASEFLKGDTETGQVGRMLLREDILRRPARLLRGTSWLGITLGGLSWRKPSQNSNAGAIFEVMHDCASPWMRQPMLEQLLLVTSSGGTKLLLAKHEIVHNSNTG